MISYVMALLGYVRVPKEVVVLSLSQESFLEKLIEGEENHILRSFIGDKIKIQKSITSFLRSGRIK